MAFLDDVVDSIASQVTEIGLAIDGTEVAGGGYAALAPDYADSSGGVADLTTALEYSGPANAGPVTGLVFKRAGGDWVTRPVDEPLSFNSDGRIDVESAPVDESFA